MTETQDHALPNVSPAITFETPPSFHDSPTNETPENFVVNSLEEYTMRPRSMSHHLSATKIPSRRWLKVQAHIWRKLMAFAHALPKFKAPAKLQPSFVRKIPTTSGGSAPVRLYFYCPPNYTKLSSQGHRFPLVVNFHGGGFCLGHATDDQNWARVVLQHTNAVFVSVDYRLAPEHPFPVPVDDSVDALVWLTGHADEYSLDMSRTALSGFSAGANLTFTVALRLEYYTKKQAPSSLQPLASSSTSDLDTPYPSTSNLLAAVEDHNRPPKRSPTATHHHDQPPSRPNPNSLQILTTIAWYPLLDWTVSRAQKKRSSLKPSATLPKIFTDLFDYSYLPPPDLQGHHCSPYASPALAPNHMLEEALPPNIQMWLCEWDMLLLEGQKFSTRLQELGKEVRQTLIPVVPHGFDQSPNPWRDQQSIDRLYASACGGLRQAFGLD